MNDMCDECDKLQEQLDKANAALILANNKIQDMKSQWWRVFE